MDEHVDAVVEVAGDGIEFDGFRVAEGADGYSFRTPSVERTGLDEDGLRNVAVDSPYVTNWYFWHAVAPQKADRWAFLRWVENAEDQALPDRYDALSEGVTAEWGQLQVTVRLAEDGKRRYDFRHEDDGGTHSGDLDVYDDPLEARTIAKYDDDEEYRPLKTAPTLQTGWLFSDLDATELVETVDFFYPATITNWHREREGELDVSHWRETMERQTGIYGLIKTWDRGEGHEHVEWVAEACCEDSQCVKRREWQYDEETDLDAPGGDGEFPCREPCSLVVASARKWTKLESEETQTYEFELTPSEKEQIEDVVDAVADGTAGEIRDADVYDGANRYRTRFLRAKLFDDEGTLAGVPTEDPDETDESSED